MDDIKYAEWVAKNWGTRVERFEPLAFNKINANYLYEFVGHDKYNQEPKLYALYVDLYSYTIVIHEITTDIACRLIFDEKFDEANYQKAVEFAHKLFEGEWK